MSRQASRPVRGIETAIAARLLAPLACALALSLSTGARADIYMFTDDTGEVHLSNVPTDKRFERVLLEPKRALAAEASAAGQRKAPMPRADYAPLIAAAALEHGLPEALLHAVIKTESNFNPNAVSPKGAVGLMQLMPDTARKLGVRDARDPADNIAGGARYLRELLGMFGNDVGIALAAYNAGPNSVVRRGNTIPPYAETRAYVPRVIGLYSRLQAAD